MINLSIAMIPKWLIFLLFLQSHSIFNLIQPANEIRIDTPRPGDALRGDVDILGSIESQQFRDYDVAFAYDSLSSTWFPLASSKQSVKNGIIAVWKTASIADGLYRLRIRVAHIDGSIDEVIIPKLRVRNYSPVETNTPAPTRYAGEYVTTPGTPVLPTLRPTPTPFPSNPAAITLPGLLKYFVQGILIALTLIIVLGLYLVIRHFLRSIHRGK